MKTVADLIDYLSQFTPDTPVVLTLEETTYTEREVAGSTVYETEAVVLEHYFAEEEA